MHSDMSSKTSKWRCCLGFN